MPAIRPVLKLQTISSSERVAWRALREISDMPFLLLSSSSSVMIGRENVMLLETVEAGGVVHQHVGVENEDFFRWSSDLACAAGLRAMLGSPWAESAVSEGFHEIQDFLGVAGDLDPRHSLRSTPSRSMTKVLRSTPRTSFP